MQPQAQDLFDAVIGNTHLVARGEAFARAVVEFHDRHDAFDEYNSPTYSGIDLYALALWTAFAPTQFFPDAGLRLATTLWNQADAIYHPALRNWCEPFTHSYHPDATRSVTLLALWKWARDGRNSLPLSNLDHFPIDHCHDIMAGTVIARLATEIPSPTSSKELPRVCSHGDRSRHYRTEALAVPCHTRRRHNASFHRAEVRPRSELMQ